MKHNLRVQPLDDGVAMRGNWKLSKDGVRESTHTEKAAAVNAARRAATEGDVVIVHGVDGGVQRSFEPQAASSSGGSESSGEFPDPGIEIDAGLDDDFADVNDILD